MRLIARVHAIAPVWRKTMKQLDLGIIVAIGPTLPAFGQGVDPFIGTWKFNAEKSSCQIAGQTCPLLKGQTLVVSKDGQNIVNNTEGVDGQGKAFKQTFQHIYDEESHPTTDPDFDTTAYTRTGNTINGVRFKET
jgi:hypothetical protein